MVKKKAKKKVTKKKVAKKAKRRAPRGALKKNLLKETPKTRRNPTRSDPTKITAAEFVEALHETGGIKVAIADNLSVSRFVVDFCLKREGDDWERVRLRYMEECASVADDAHATMKWLIKQRHDPALALAASRWYLEKKETWAAPKVTVEMRNLVSLDKLNLPLKIRRVILTAIKDAEKEAKQAARASNANWNGNGASQ